MKFKLNNYEGVSGATILVEHHSVNIGGRFVCSTGINIDPKYWDTDGGQLSFKAKGKEFQETRDLLLSIYECVEGYSKLPVQSKDELKKLIKEVISERARVQNIKKHHETMLELWTGYLDDIRSTVKPDTLSSYKQSRKIFEEFLTEKRLDKIKTEHFTFRLLNQYGSWILDREYKPGKKYTPNQKAKLFKKLSGFCRYAMKDNHVFGMNIKDIKYKEEPRRKIALNRKQIESLINLDLPIGSRLDRLRDLMVAHALTGVRISDLFRLNSKIVVNNRFPVRQQKTGKLVHIPIYRSVRAILEKYDGGLPVYSQKEYRLGVKDVYALIDPTGMIEIVDEYGDSKQVLICKEIIPHDMIRTFVNFAHGEGIKITAIALIVGKSVKVLLKNYLITDNEESALEEAEKIDI